eukprot:6209531-Pleurochrysis_carterae.AAC.1
MRFCLGLLQSRVGNACTMGTQGSDRALLYVSVNCTDLSKLAVEKPPKQDACEKQPTSMRHLLARNLLRRCLEVGGMESMEKKESEQEKKKKASKRKGEGLR